MKLRFKRWILRLSALKTPLIKLLRHCTIISACVFSSTAIANPDTPTVAAGNASFETLGNTLLINNSPGTIINWQGFSISPSEITRFIQQSDLSAVLNRVTGGMSSSLQGQLLSNGKVFLINPNGIVIGNGALIDTSGFVGSTLDINDQDFLSGNYRFSGNGGAITNNGVITSGPGGEVILIAPSIENAGEINAENGEIILAAGQEVTLTSLDSEHISFLVSAPGNRAVNLGSLIAQNGAIGVFADQVTQSGTVSANRVSQDGAGRIVLHGNSSTEISGTVSALGEDVPGGEIQILGDKITLQSASIDASGTNGGRVLIGGEFQGRGSLPRAKQTDLDQNTVVHADAIERGQGGEIIVWSEQSTRTLGRLTARGGAVSGDGGLVETSSRGSLDFGQPADVSATDGNPGTWLLDPEDIVIDSGKANSISSALNGGSNVNIKTADSGSGEGNITVAAPIRKTEGDDASLGLIAHSKINVNAPIESTAGKLNVSLRAGRDISVNASIATNGGQYSASINPALAPPEPEQAEVAEEADQAEEAEVAEVAEVAEEAAQEQVEQNDAQSSQTVDQASDEIASTSENENIVQQQAEVLSNIDETELIDIDDTTPSHGISLLASIDTGGGDVVVDAGSDGLLTINSTLDAGNTETGNTGGNIQLLGNQVGLFDSAVVNASGSAGGGTVLIGGDQQGANPEVANADAVYISESASVHADALDQGDGGRVIVFAEKAANVYGEISARGGSNGGDGGFVETSGRQSLRVTAAPDVSAANGNAGEWLIDPATITIDNTAETGPLSPNPFEASSDTIIGVDLISNSLATGGDVTIIATGPSAADTDGNINFLADLDLFGFQLSALGDLVLRATNDITIVGSILDPTAADVQLNNLELRANTDNVNGGDVIIDATARDTIPNPIAPGQRIEVENTLLVRGDNFRVNGGDSAGESITINADTFDIDVSNAIIITSGTATGTTTRLTAAAGASNVAAREITMQYGAGSTEYLEFDVDSLNPTSANTLTLENLTLNGGRLSLGGDVITDQLDLTAGNINLNELTTNGIVNISGSNIKAVRSIWNVGPSSTVNWMDGNIRLEGIINNEGVFDAQDDDAFSVEVEGGPPGIFNNMGQFVKSGTSGGATSFFGVEFNNDGGQLLAQSGDIHFSRLTQYPDGLIGGFIQNSGSTELEGGTISAVEYSDTVGANVISTLEFFGGELAGGISSASGITTGGEINANVNLENTTVAVGQSPGTLTINGDLEATDGTVFDIELGGTTAGDFDTIIVNGTATLRDTPVINAVLYNGFSPPAGTNTNNFEVIRASTLNIPDGVTVNHPAALRAGVAAANGQSGNNYFLSYTGEPVYVPPTGGGTPRPRSTPGGFTTPDPRIFIDTPPTTDTDIPAPPDSSGLIVTLFNQQPRLELDEINESPEFLQCY